MEIEKARRMLNLATNEYGNKEVEEIIGQTEVLARLFIDHYKSNKRLLTKNETVYNENADNNQKGAHGLA